MRTFRLHLSALTIAATLAGVLAIAPPARAAARVKLATIAPKGTSFHQILLEMGEKWRAAPGGGVNLTVYTDGSMGGEADMVRRMRIGQIQAAMLTVTGLIEIDDSVAALQNMPMVFRSLEEVEFVRQKLQPDLERRFREKGFIALFWGDGGWVRFFSRKPATMPDDYTNMKMFVWSGDNRMLDLWKLAGYQPVPLEVTDILPGLQTGLIDALCSTPSYALAGQFYGPAPNMLDLHWAPLVGGTVITEKSWNALPAESRDTLMKTAAEAGAKITARSRVENEESIEAMKKRGLHVQPVTEEIEAVWRKRCEDFYPKIRGSVVPAATFDQVQKLLAEYRASGAKAHP